MDETKGINLDGKETTDDDLVKKLIAAEEAKDHLRRQVKALSSDRAQMLDELHDIRNARSVPHQEPPKKRTRADTVRASAGDVHGMLQDTGAVAAFIGDLKLLEPDVIVLGGDVMECGGWLAKHQPIGFIALCDYSYQEDMQAANDFLDRVQTAAPHAEIHYLEGNHEDRVERWIVDQVMAHKRDAEFLRELAAPPTLLRLEERGIKYYRRSEIYVEGAPRGWFKLGHMFFTHELGRSKHAASQAVEKTAANVTYFHTHREDTATRVFPGVGICKAFNPGCLCSMQPVWKHSDPTTWSQGYGIDFIAKDGIFQRVHVPIWRGESLANAMIERFKS